MESGLHNHLQKFEVVCKSPPYLPSCLPTMLLTSAGYKLMYYHRLWHYYHLNHFRKQYNPLCSTCSSLCTVRQWMQQDKQHFSSFEMKCLALLSFLGTNMIFLWIFSLRIHQLKTVLCNTVVAWMLGKVIQHGSRAMCCANGERP